ncbi:PLP-dependent aminotransferase family protein [Reyranella sp. CPCC 100927]|uniref:MocR-like pyridoxine biosynthesis transcription factor PdxR n=1 Tax=Reyranella sp. CPCC 100927 TaxID=2599616 RepID=UPI0011B6C9AD|nr:PLP-dependent aminotransferase family protein [Reyranella sp. CPCC 100927]TWT08787.1 PLP-dependent aminotransferase family protein [Reyranella sp. CPCC 100927]
MQLPIQIDRNSPTPLQAQLTTQLRQLILGGQIRSGTVLPGSREMAVNLRLSRNTVLLSYDRLTIEGFLETRAAKGTFVSRRLAREQAVPRTSPCPPIDTTRAWASRSVEVTQARPSFDFSFGNPGADAFPALAWRRLVLQKLAQTGTLLARPGDPSGLPELRHAIADHLGPARGLAIHADQVIIVSGVQEALNVICRLFAVGGTSVVIENPGYRRACEVFDSYGARLQPVPVDRDGLDPVLLPEQPVSLAYVTPSHQFPTGGTLPIARRLQLLAWAERTGAWIIEDDHDSDFRYDSPPVVSLAGMARTDNVIYLGTFSKAIGGGLRVGYMIVPSHLTRAAITAKSIFNGGTSWLDQAVLADFITGGGYAKHLRRLQRMYKGRLEVLLDALRSHFGAVDLHGQQGGMHVLWRLPRGWPAAPHVEHAARSRGIAVYGLRSGMAVEYGARTHTDTSLLLGYASISETLIRKGIARLAEIISDSPGSAGVPPAFGA